MYYTKIITKHVRVEGSQTNDSIVLQTAICTDGITLSYQTHIRMCNNWLKLLRYFTILFLIVSLAYKYVYY